MRRAENLHPFDRAAESLRSSVRAAELIAVDGLPCAGKSTFAALLASKFRLQILDFDNFYLPEEAWPVNVAPTFPFPFFRVTEFYEAVHSLKTKGRCLYRAYHWGTCQISKVAHELHRHGPLVVDGCSVLDPQIVEYFDLRVFIESDPATLMETRLARDGDVDTLNWHRLFLPSFDIYMRTMPQERADIVISGRGMKDRLGKSS
jgi:uridine kinase